MPSEKFLAREHIKTEADFSRVYAARCSSADDVLVVYVRANGLSYSRLGMSVAKRVGRAVDRTYVRRRTREAFRRNKAALPRGFDIVCVARTKAKSPKSDVALSLVGLVEQAVSRWDRRKNSAGTPKPSSDRRVPSGEHRRRALRQQEGDNPRG